MIQPSPTQRFIMTEVGIGAIPSTFATFTFILSNLYLQTLWNFQKISQHLPGAFGAKKPPVPAAAEARAARAKLTSQLDMAIRCNEELGMRWLKIRGAWGLPIFREMFSSDDMFFGMVHLEKADVFFGPNLFQDILWHFLP